MNPLILLYHLLVLTALLGVLVNFLLNLLAAPRLYPSPLPGDGPLVSVLVPARNEAAGIARCLRSLQGQDYPRHEIIVLDDQSSDGTGEIARGLGFVEEGKWRLIQGTALPKGWVGKPWACQQLAQAARGDYLLFTDADTDHAPFALSTAMAEVLESRADLLSLWPHQETGTWSERWIIPLLCILGAGMVPHWLLEFGQNHPALWRRVPVAHWRTLGVANGQYLLFKRESYEQIGGHVAVAGHLVEDVALGRLMASRTGEGMILRNCDGTLLVRTRMYRNFAQLWEGFTKNAWPVCGGKKVNFVLGLASQLLVMVLPLALLPFAGDSHWILIFEAGLIVLVRVVFALHFRTSWLGVLCHPLAYLLATAIAINSYRQSHRKGVVWKGRNYEVGA